MSLEAGEFTDYSFWRNEIQEAESIHDLFDICEELLEEIQIKADKNLKVETAAALAIKSPFNI